MFLNWSCAARMFVSEKNSDSIENSTKKIIDNTSKNNISEENYFIEKGDLLVTNNNSTSRFIFTGKFEKPDKFLFSIRNLTGIEGARIYITKDTVLINDRIKKRLLYGKPERLEKITGLPSCYINMAFGDLLSKENVSKNRTEKNNDKLILLQKYNDKTIKSILETRIAKVKSVVFLNGFDKKEISLEYSKFCKKKKHIPGVIMVMDHERNIQARIRLKKLQIPWNGKIEFIPGLNYIKEEIR